MINIEVGEELFLREQLLQKEMALEQEQLAKAQLVKRLTEDIKKPIEQLIQFSQIALLRMKQKDLDKIPSYLVEMKMISEELLLYTNDLREIALIKSGECKFNFSEIDAKSFLRSIQSKFTEIAENAKVNLTFFLQSKGIYIVGDYPKLIKVINIILSNMIAYSNEGETIKIQIVEQKDHAEIIMLDNNPHHFSKLNLHNLYFHFEDRECKDKIPGFNISVCRELMLGQKGDIKLESTDQGTKFILSLPLSKTF